MLIESKFLYIKLSRTIDLTNSTLFYKIPKSQSLAGHFSL